MNERILLIEDDQSTADLYKRSLERAGYHMDHAMDGPRGLQMAQQHEYNLILLDIMLPGKSGLSVLKEIKEMKIQEQSKIYMISNLGDDLIKKQAANAGADGFIVKFDIVPTNLAAEVEKIIKEPAAPQTKN